MNSLLFRLLLVCAACWHLNSRGSIITNQSPALQMISVGSNATFFVQADTSASPVTYQWQFNGAPIANVTDSTLTLANIGYASDGCYTAVVTRNSGSETSSCMQLIAMDLPRALNATNMTWTIGGDVNWTWQTNTSVDGVAGVSGILPVVTYHSSYAEATVLGPGTLSFWWRMEVFTPYLDEQEFALNGVTRGFISGGNSWVQDGPYYLPAGTNVMRWNYNGNYYSYLDQVTFTPGGTAPILSSGPSNQVVASGNSISLSATADGTPPLQYQWQFFGTNLPSATGTSLTIPDAQSANEGTYSVIVTNPAGTASASAVVTVTNTPPHFTRGPALLTVLAGTAATFSPTLIGSKPFTYQWLFNGAAIAGATQSTLVITNVAMSNAGAYQLAVTNAFGSALRAGALYVGHTVIFGWGQGAYAGPVPPLGLTNAVQLGANAYVVSALRSDGPVTSWGLNEQGLITYTTNLSNVISIAVGGSHQLALTRDGTVIGWGYNYYGGASPPSGLSNVVAISAAGYFSMALRNDGKVFCWGQNNAGQTNVPPTLSNVVAIAAGSDHCVALKRNGTVACWGNNSVGQSTPPADLNNVIAIAAGNNTSQAIRADGTLVAWGNTQETNVPPGLNNLFQVAEGQYHNLAVKNDGTLAAWLDTDGASNDHGQGNVPPGLSNVVSIAAAYNLNMVIIADTPPLSHAALTNPAKVDAGAPFQVQIPTQNGRVYALEYSQMLPASNWIALPLQAGTGGLVTFSDPAPTNTARFYRLRRW